MVNDLGINPVGWIVFLLCLLVAGLVSFKLGERYRKKIAEASIKSAEEEAKRIVNDAIRLAETKKKEILVDAKDDVFKMRGEAEKELKERRAELGRQERRASQKEDALGKKIEAAEKKEEQSLAKLKEAKEKLEETEIIKKHEFELLEKISGFSKEQAREQVLIKLEQELDHDKALKLAEYNKKLDVESREMAREVISQAIQRYSVDDVAEITVAVVSLPSDEMKGRIIGREGRNIKSLEMTLGVDLIIDDTPEVITISCHDPIRREIARMTLEKLITDGRIHPGRIEEMVEKCRKDLDQKMRTDGEQALLGLGIHNVHAELTKLIGKLKYRTSYGQNIYMHSLEVSNLAAMMAEEIGANVAIAKRAGLLHDIGKAMSHEVEGSHVQIGVDLAKKYKESPAVIHIIEAHHGDIDANSPEAFLVQAADAISAARPGARKENLEKYIKRIAALEEIARSFRGVAKSYAIQAGREVRIMVNPDDVSDDGLILLASAIAAKMEQGVEYPGQVKISMIREKRVDAFAK
ncbi:MAG: ribonuclease Y [Oscillospiraceae bacterium]|jgi:ribonuclease Y|nr:ribonuclease Y [Oscillospiraceae bacterium]